MADGNPIYAVRRRIRFARWLVRPMFRGIFHILSRVSISGLENIPSSGAYLIAINHISIVEPPFVLAFWPLAPEAVGAVDIWSRRGQASLASIYGGIRVHRGEYDRRLLDTMVAILNSGRPLLIAPEGGRSHKPGMRKAFPGVAYALDKAQVPVLPVGIIGSTDDFLHQALKGGRPTLEMCIGEPLRLPKVEGKGEARREALQRNADLIMFRIAALLPPDYRGVYSDESRAVVEAP